jgi:SM-20-related protein
MDVEPREVAVEILLAGGHRYEITLPSDSALLQSLVAALAAKLHGPAHPDRTFFQVPLHGGRKALSFSDGDLAAITTSPPVLIESGAPVLKLHQAAPAVTGHADPATNLVPTRWTQLDNVLSAEDVARLRDFVLTKEAELRPSSVTTEVYGHRQSRVLFSFPEFEELLRDRVRAYLPTALRELAVPPFHVAHIEAQMTAHNDGDFFKVHADSGDQQTATRELTYVYYFHREPKGYTGGELLLYDSRLVDGALTQADSFTLIEPRHNSMVFFPSRGYHEVLTVHCPSRKFEDSRFTVNGWVRRDG